MSYFDIQPIYSAQYMIQNNQLRILKTELARNNEIVNSGTGTHSYRDTRSPGAFIDTEINIRSYDRLENEHKVINPILERMAVQIDQVMEVATNLQTTMMRVSGQPDPTFQIEIRGYLETLTSILNQGDGIQSTLAGAASDHKAVVDLRTLTPTETVTSLNTGYYLGAEGNQEITLADIVIDKYPITAADPFFAKVIHACRMCLTVNPSDDETTCLNDAKNLCEQATHSDFRVASQKVTQQLFNLERARDFFPQAKINEKVKQNDLNMADQVSAILAIKTLQGTLDMTQNMQMLNAKFERQYVEALSRL